MDQNEPDDENQEQDQEDQENRRELLFEMHNELEDRVEQLENLLLSEEE